MKTEKRFCFSRSPGEDIYLYSLVNDRGTEVLISNYGAIISSFKLPVPGSGINDIVLGFGYMEDYFSKKYLDGYPWFGCAVGRYANRIKNAAFTIDGKKYSLTRNRGNDQLHGGISGFDKKIWQFAEMGSTPVPYLELKYWSKDGEEGFPGNLELLVRFELNNENELSYQYRATTDQPTAINLTHHSYFNLGNSKGSIHDQEIKIHASRVLEQGENLVATGLLESVQHTPFDFREFYAIGKGLERIDEYDKSFLIDKTGNETVPALVAEARSLQSGLLLKVYSTEPVVHFYSGKWIPLVRGKMGEEFGPFSGFCLETHQHPNAINIPHFPNTVLRPGETYFQKTVYKVSS